MYNDGNFLERIQKQVDDLNLKDIVKFHGIVPVESIAAAIESIDVGIVPNRMTPFTNLNFPTRIFECLIMEKPVIVPPTQGIRDYFDDGSIFFFKAGDVEDLAQQIFNIYSKASENKEIVARGVKVYQQNRWELQRENLAGLAATLLGKDSLDRA